MKRGLVYGKMLTQEVSISLLLAGKRVGNDNAMETQEGTHRLGGRQLIWDFTSILEMKPLRFLLMTISILTSQAYLLLPTIESESGKDTSAPETE